MVGCTKQSIRFNWNTVTILSRYLIHRKSSHYKTEFHPKLLDIKYFSKFSIEYKLFKKNIPVDSTGIHFSYLLFHRDSFVPTKQSSRFDWFTVTTHPLYLSYHKSSQFRIELFVSISHLLFSYLFCRFDWSIPDDSSGKKLRYISKIQANSGSNFTFR